ncbi:putative nucleic acid-binding, replication factor A [Helianthus annuus]|nr:putative nucleic acid-binding, replication factor A [Helianthus annuus]KAJ0530939.1 putative nucleic acid-binding, replication factor A [Helianthus annuus]
MINIYSVFFLFRMMYVGMELLFGFFRYCASFRIRFTNVLLTYLIIYLFFSYSLTRSCFSAYLCRFLKMDNNGISGLRPKGPAPALEVRVIRKWVPKYRENELHFVFVDEEGMGIQAFVKGKNCKTLDSKLCLQTCYQIKGYGCTDPDNFTNTLTHPATMNLGNATVITSIPDNENIPKQYFELATRRRMEVQAKTEGIVDKKTHENRPYVVLSLKDCSNQDVTVALWEEIATVKSRFNRAEIEAGAAPVILAMTGLKAKTYYGTLQLSSTSSTHVYLNPQTVETETLKEMYKNSDMQNWEITTPTDLEVPISHLLQSNASIIGKSFIIRGKITEIMSYNDWYYTACPKCRQTVLQTGSNLVCVDDGNLDKAVCMYRIPVKISDKTGTITGTIFDRAANQLLQQTCEEALTKQNLTQQLQSMENKEAKFQIQVQPDLKNRSIRCTINNANYLHTETTYHTSTSTPPITTPQPVTPPPKGQNINYLSLNMS